MSASQSGWCSSTPAARDQAPPRAASTDPARLAPGSRTIGVRVTEAEPGWVVAGLPSAEVLPALVLGDFLLSPPWRRRAGGPALTRLHDVARRRAVRTALSSTPGVRT
ncbi:MAG: hypothetical protein L0I24_20505, partial [Pseudonocardia sp.]|nr:hypothetical protein [Pseudonocardia sp.]